MCGIAGTARLGDLDVVHQMIAALRYRGPDDVGFYRDGDVILGNCRLSIQDLSAAGHMPMESDDGELVVTFNGEIYNFRELGSALGALGHKIRTGTDTEIILHAYRAYGLGCLEQLEGMFAFALWDRRRGQLLLARDRTGMKPLFYHVANGGIAFASELKSLLHIPGFERRVNRRALRSARPFREQHRRRVDDGVHLQAAAWLSTDLAGWPLRTRPVLAPPSSGARTMGRDRTGQRGADAADGCRRVSHGERRSIGCSPQWRAGFQRGGRADGATQRSSRRHLHGWTWIGRSRPPLRPARR